MPLHYACYNKTDGAEAIIHVVLEAAPDVATVAGQWDRLPLHVACQYSKSAAAVQEQTTGPTGEGAGDPYLFPGWRGEPTPIGNSWRRFHAA